jgi:methionyl-tRNA synthetase
VKRFLVTSALPYANGDIHIGHLVEYIQTDIYVRFLKLIGEHVLYICASDAHGTPIEINASKRGITPHQLVEEYHQRHLRDFSRFEIQFDEFYTTDSPENKKHSENIYLKARERGHISEREIDQYYCSKCGRFLPDRFIRGVCPKCGAPDQYGDVCEVCGATYRPTEIKDARCAICEASPEMRSSRHFFLKLVDFADFLDAWTAKPGRLQPEIRGFVSNWIRQGLQDWDISRDGPYFGFKIPGEQDKYFYVWLDAPTGYIAATEHYCTVNGRCSVDDYWLSQSEDLEIHHFIGKDIAYFHTLFWPAMLTASGYRTPDFIHVHGFLTVDSRKMSKSRGTFITAGLFADHVSPWYLRYYYATKLSNSIDDLDLSLEEFVNRTNSELVNNVTNLVSRTIGFLNKRLDSRLGKLRPDTEALIAEVNSCIERAKDAYHALRFGQATREILAISDLANNFVQQRGPWDTIKTDPERARDDLTFVVNCIKIISVLLKPILPSYCQKVETILRVGDLTWDDARFDMQHAEVGRFEKLAERLDPKVMEKLVEAAREGLLSSQESAAVESLPDLKEEVTIEDFGKIDLRAGKVLTAETVEGSDKLLKLSVDIGLEIRTIFAGIKSSYRPDALIGKTVAVICNLKPRKMRFGTSNGMVLASGDEGHIVVCEFSGDVRPGTPIR